MKFDNLLNTYGKENKIICLANLSRLGNKLFEKDKWNFNPYSYDSETVTSDSGNWYHVTIGNAALNDNCNDSECNRAAYVLEVKDMYHEKQHVWQNTTAWNDKATLNSVKSHRQTTDIIRREFIKKYFPSVYYNNYSSDPGEMEAESRGIRLALIYFKSDPVISKTEAEDILYQIMMSDDCIHKKILEPDEDRLKSIYDVLDLFEKRAETAASVKYDITMNIPSRFRNDPDIDLSMTDTFLHSRNFKEYRKAFVACRTGIEQDKILEQVILFAHPNAVRKAPLRIRNELSNCRRQMELGTLRPGIHAILPKHINYSVQTISETEELKLTDEDLTSIPVTDKNNINLQ